MLPINLEADPRSPLKVLAIGVGADVRLGAGRGSDGGVGVVVVGLRAASVAQREDFLHRYAPGHEFAGLVGGVFVGEISLSQYQPAVELLGPAL